MSYRAFVDGISVTGRGQVTVTPDTAILTLGVSVLDRTAAQAAAKAADAQQALVDSLEKHGIAPGDRQTNVLRVMPEYDYKDGAQRLRGYRVTNTLAVTVRSLDELPALIDDALQAAGDSAVLHGVEFDAEGRRGLERQALEAAVADARARAEVLASATGSRLGQVTSLDARETSSGAPIPRMATMAERSGAATPVEPGSIEIEARVEITYEIGGG
jgi:uncharacterized protein YggE